jgi:hypothetical protein
LESQRLQQSAMSERQIIAARHRKQSWHEDCINGIDTWPKNLSHRQKIF